MLAKRLFDLVASALAIVTLWPILLAVAAAIRVLDGPPVLFRQERVGRAGVPFVVLKFRTMRTDSRLERGFTAGVDPRITRLGRVLRKYKIDELPQLLNVLIGHMSLVGPRPELREFVELFADDYREILQVRPGLTDLASIKYRDEASLLAASPDPRRAYVEQILPDKIRLAREYVRSRSFLLDLRIAVRTLIRLPQGSVPAAGGSSGGREHR